MFKTVGICVLACALAFAATTDTPSTAAKRKTTKKAVHSTSTKVPASASTASTPSAKSGSVASKSKAGRTSKSKRVVRSYQQAPTPDRYKEIQQALIDKGYLHGVATGQWGPDDADALKRFQTDQNLTADGKIGSLSLIALGLGPKRLTAQSSSQVPANPPK